MASILLGLLTVLLGASIGAYAARGAALRERLLYAIDAWRARSQCDCYIAEIAALNEEHDSQVAGNFDPRSIAAG